MKEVEVRELVKDYGNLRAIKGISFEVNEGEVFGLIGANGAGKTTALRVIATLLQITSGSITVFGYELPKEAGEGRKIISYLPEEAGAHKKLTGREDPNIFAQFFGE